MTREIKLWCERKGIGNRGLMVPLGKLPPNTVRCLEQVPRESFEVARIPWNSDGRGNTCEMEK